MDRVKESLETSKELYQQMLGLGDNWEVSLVDLDITGKEVQISLTYLKEEACCSECAAQGKVYDHTPTRRWKHLDTMQFSTVLEAKTPRVDCSGCGNVKSARLPWAGKHSHFTLQFEAFAIQVLEAAKSITDARKVLGLTWNQAQTIMKRAVERGLLRRNEEEIPWLGMDEKSFRKGHRYISVLNDLEEGRVIEVAEGRSSEVAEKLLEEGLSENQRELVCGVSIDMSAPYIKAIEKLLPHADIVHDKFHISQHLTKAVDLTRRREHKQLMKEGDESLKGTKYQWLKNETGLSQEELQAIKRASSKELEVSKAYYLKELFSYFWQKYDKKSALSFLLYWVREVIDIGNKEMLKVAKMLRKHLENILTYFDCFITNAVSEGINSKIQSLKANARGFRSFQNYRTTILFFCGKLKLAP